MKLRVQQCDFADALESVIGGLDGRGGYDARVRPLLY